MTSPQQSSFCNQQLSYQIPKKWILFWVFALAVTAWCSQGWLQPDEHARVLEPAHYFAYGFATLPWELSGETPIVSWLLGFLLSPILLITKQFGLSGLTEAALLRFLVGLLTSTRLLIAPEVMARLGLKRSNIPWYIFTMAFVVFGPIFYVRTSQENFAVTALFWSFLFGLRILQDGVTLQRSVWFGVLIGLAGSFRPQVGIASASLAVYVLCRTGRPLLGKALLGLSLGLLPIIIVDVLTVQEPFLPFYHYLKYALGNEEGGHVWGTSPWWFYVIQYFESWYPPLSPFLLLPLALGIRKFPAIASVIIPFTVVHFILGHKETRYFSPMVPFLHLAMFLGIEDLYERSEKFRKLVQLRFWPSMLKVVAVLTLLAGLFSINTSPRMYTDLGDLAREGKLDSFTYVGNSHSGVSKFYLKLDKDITYKQVSWNEFKSGEKPLEAGWLAFYALDPEDYLKIVDLCGAKSIYRETDYLVKVLLMFPKSPARKKLNPIIQCPKPIHWFSSKS